MVAKCRSSNVKRAENVLGQGRATHGISKHIDFWKANLAGWENTELANEVLKQVEYGCSIGFTGEDSKKLALVGRQLKSTLPE